MTSLPAEEAIRKNHFSRYEYYAFSRNMWILSLAVVFWAANFSESDGLFRDYLFSRLFIEKQFLGAHEWGGSSMEGKGYTEASSTYWSDSLLTISSRKGRSRSSSDEIRFSDFSASFWGPVRRSAGTRAFSGDVSLSSNSSNASAHSFAFPVLPAEWNGSPVRMAVADPRQLRKQRSWKTSLLMNERNWIEQLVFYVHNSSSMEPSSVTRF